MDASIYLSSYVVFWCGPFFPTVGAIGFLCWLRVQGLRRLLFLVGALTWARGSGFEPVGALGCENPVLEADLGLGFRL